MSHNSPDLIQFFGRFHPVLVHLPIGFLMLLAALEALALHPRFKDLTASCRTILVLSIPAAVVSATCGWLLSWGDGYDAQLLFWHKWLGTSLAASVMVLLILHWRGWVCAYRAAVVATLGLMCVTGHFGGMLTHGRGYLSDFAPASLRPLLGGIGTGGPPAGRPVGDPMTQPFYAAVIQPIFNQNCIACHGPSKSKAKLRLDSLENVLKGGEDGAVIVPGDAAQSLLLKRVGLPPEDEDHMPPEGKRQPSEDQLMLLQWWVEAGAPTGQPARELNPPENILRILEPKTKAFP